MLTVYMDECSLLQTVTDRFLVGAIINNQTTVDKSVHRLSFKKHSAFEQDRLKLVTPVFCELVLVYIISKVPQGKLVNIKDP